LPALGPNQMQALFNNNNNNNNNNNRTLIHSHATTCDYMVHGQTSASYTQQQQQQQADCLAKHTWFKRDVRAIATQASPTATLLLTQTNNTRPYAHNTSCGYSAPVPGNHVQARHHQTCPCRTQH
jgi:hypothetical protein